MTLLENVTIEKLTTRKSPQKKRSEIKHGNTADQIVQQISSTQQTSIIKKILEVGFAGTEEFVLDFLSDFWSQKFDDLDKKLISQLIVQKIVKQNFSSLNRREIYLLAEILQDIDGFDYDSYSWNNYIDLHRPIQEMAVNEIKIKGYLDTVSQLLFGIRYNLHFNHLV